MNQQDLNDLVGTLDTMREEQCPDCGGSGEIMRPGDFPNPVECLACNGTGKVPDPQAQAAWEVLTHEHFFACGGGYLEDDIKHKRCGCHIGRIPWNISEPPWPDGAQIGLLQQAIKCLWPMWIVVGTWAGLPKALATAFQQALENR